MLASVVPLLAVAAAHGLDHAVTRMGVAVDQARHDDLVLGVDDRAGLIGGRDLVVVPTATIRSFSMATAPFSMTRRSGSIVTTMPLVMMMSAIQISPDVQDRAPVSPRMRSRVGTSDSNSRV